MLPLNECPSMLTRSASTVSESIRVVARGIRLITLSTTGRDAAGVAKLTQGADLTIL